MLAVDQAGFLALGQLGTVGRWREKAANAGTRRADTFGQIALRHEFQFDFTGAIERVEYIRIALPWERADDLAHALRL